MTRSEIRRRALRAAAAVSLTMGVIGCGGVVVVDPASDSDGVGDPGGGKGPPIGPHPPVKPPPIMVDAGGEVVDAGGEIADAGVPDAIADAADAAVVNCTTAPDYVKCCEEQNWSPDAGCMAWGPPMPPSMEIA